MQPEKGQYFMFTESELSLIKNTFAENDELLYAVRNVLLQFALSDAQRAVLSVGCTPAVIKVLKKRIFPEIDGSFPLGQLPSVLTTLTKDLSARPVEDMGPQFEAKELEIKYLAQQFHELETGEKGELRLADMAVLGGKGEREQFVNMTAYLFLLGYIDPMLAMIQNLAGSKDETPEEQKKRLTRDSNK